jgi:hypothetical protein
MILVEEALQKKRGEKKFQTCEQTTLSKLRRIYMTPSD